MSEKGVPTVEQIARVGEPITLMLVGGGSRSPAFAGALRAIEQKGLTPNQVVGASTGSIVAALYAAGMTSDEIAADSMALDAGIFKDISTGAMLNGYGLCSGNALERWLEERLGGRTFKDQGRIPLRIIATDILNYEPLLFSAETTPDFSIATAVRCSAGVPGVFACRRLTVGGKERVLVDGMLMAGIIEKQLERSEKTLVLKTVSKRTLHRSRPGLFNLESYALELLNYFMHGQEKEFIKGGKWKDTILIYCADISPARFSLSRQERLYLHEQGYEQTLQYLEYKWGI